MRGFCEGQIAHNKIPRYVEFVDEFPMTVTGKVQKFLMRKAVEERLGLARRRRREGGGDAASCRLGRGAYIWVVDAPLTPLPQKRNGAPP